MTSTYKTLGLLLLLGLCTPAHAMDTNSSWMTGLARLIDIGASALKTMGLQGKHRRASIRIAKLKQNIAELKQEATTTPRLAARASTSTASIGTQANIGTDQPIVVPRILVTADATTQTDTVEDSRLAQLRNAVLRYSHEEAAATIEEIQSMLKGA